MNLQFILACDGTPENLSGWEGVFSTPDYPNDYSASKTCQWELTVPSGLSVDMVIEDPYQIEPSTGSKHDYMVYTSSSWTNVFGGRVCGINELASADNSLKFSSSHNKMIVKFISDATKTFSGFKARYVTKPKTSSEYPYLIS